jgi:hypothetical protein
MQRRFAGREKTMNVCMIAFIDGKMLMSESPLRMTLEECKANVASHQRELVGQISAAYTASERGLRLKCVESETNPNTKRPTIAPFVTK